MATFGEFIREQREKLGMNQTEFGAKIKASMTDVSKIENDRKKFAVSKLEILASIINIDFKVINDLYFKDKFAKEAAKYHCSEDVFTAAESQVKYMRSKNVKQYKIDFK